MKKFGFGKKDKSAGGDDDANRSALFGKKSASGPAPTENPYAQAGPSNDPYTDSQKYVSPYQQARNNLGPPAQGPGPQGRPGGLPSGPGVRRQDSGSSTATAPPPYSNASPASGGYSNEKYGAPSGYGGNKYASSGAPSGAQAQRPGGYGGFGRTDSNGTDDNRDALFSGAQQRQQQQRVSNNNNAYAANSGAGKYGGYGEDRELTAQEQEDREADDIKDEIRDIRQQSKNTVMNSEAITNQILENASATYARLGAQHERLNYTEQQLDHGSLAARHARTQGLKELQYHSRSMWNPGVKNPFTSNKRNQDYETALLEQNHKDRATREATRQEGYNANMNMEQGFKSLSGTDPSRGAWKPTSAAERSKYTFEEGESDEEEIDQGLERLSNNVHKINLAARLIGDEIDSQNALIDRLGTKSDALSDTTLLNTATLQKISRKG